MVHQALEATKSFIFDVRPMVLDDLGLVPTLRRSASELSRRSGVAVRFESVGTDRRLPTEVESGLFRMVDDAVAAYVRLRATAVLCAWIGPRKRYARHCARHRQRASSRPSSAPAPPLRPRAAIRTCPNSWPR